MSKKSSWFKSSKTKKYFDNDSKFSDYGSSDYNGFGYSSFAEEPKSTAEFKKGFRVFISENVYKKLFSFVKSTNLEVSGLGMVKEVKNGYDITDVFVFEQLSSGASTDLDRNAMTKLLLKLVKEKKDVSNLRLWWHSHPHFETFWSGTDDATCERLTNDKFVIAIVVSHDYSLKCRIDLIKPFRVTLDSVPVEIGGSVKRREGIVSEFRNEAMKKVKEYEFKNFKFKNFKFGNGNSFKLLPLHKENKVESNTLFVNPITHKSSYRKEDVLKGVKTCRSCNSMACAECSIFEKLMVGGGS